MCADWLPALQSSGFYKNVGVETGWNGTSMKTTRQLAVKLATPAEDLDHEGGYATKDLPSAGTGEDEQENVSDEETDSGLAERGTHTHVLREG